MTTEDKPTVIFGSSCFAARPVLTSDEQQAIEAAARIIDAYDEEMDGFASGAAETLRALLARCVTGRAIGSE